MAVTLELKPELERRMAAHAAERGLSLEAYLLSVIEGAAMSSVPEEFTMEQFEADMDAIAEGSERLPVLPPEAFSRESIYADHD